MSQRPFVIVGAFAALLALVIAGWTGWRIVESARAPRPTATGVAAIGGPFSLTDHHGRAVTDADYRGRFLLVYFGFTSCPDVCPTDLGTMVQAVESLGEDATRVQPLFISVDPERDTPEQLAQYVPLFGDRLVGLTGTPAQVAEAASQYKVYFARNGEGPDYTMDHSSFTFLMAPDGSFLSVFPHGTSTRDMADALGRAIAERPA